MKPGKHNLSRRPSKVHGRNENINKGLFLVNIYIAFDGESDGYATPVAVRRACVISVCLLSDCPYDCDNTTDTRSNSRVFSSRTERNCCLHPVKCEMITRIFAKKFSQVV